MVDKIPFDTLGTLLVLFYGIYAVIKRNSVGENLRERQKNYWHKTQGDTKKQISSSKTYSNIAAIVGLIAIAWAFLRLLKLHTSWHI